MIKLGGFALNQKIGLDVEVKITRYWWKSIVCWIYMLFPLTKVLWQNLPSNKPCIEQLSDTLATDQCFEYFCNEWVIDSLQKKNVKTRDIAGSEYFKSLILAPYHNEEYPCDIIDTRKPARLIYVGHDDSYHALAEILFDFDWESFFTFIQRKHYSPYKPNVIKFKTSDGTIITVDTESWNLWSTADIPHIDFEQYLADTLKAKLLTYWLSNFTIGRSVEYPKEALKSRENLENGTFEECNVNNLPVNICIYANSDHNNAMFPVDNNFPGYITIPFQVSSKKDILDIHALCIKNNLNPANIIISAHSDWDSIVLRSNSPQLGCKELAEAFSLAWTLLSDGTPYLKWTCILLQSCKSWVALIDCLVETLPWENILSWPTTYSSAIIRSNQSWLGIIWRDVRKIYVQRWH